MIQVLKRAAVILEHVAARRDRPCRLRDLAALLEISPSACANIVSSMVKLGYLESAGREGYRLGPAPSLLVRFGMYKRYLTQCAAPFLDELVAAVNENCLIATRSDDKRIVLLIRKSTRELQVNDPVITENLMLSATGCVMLAWMPETELDRYERIQPFEGSIFPDVSGWKEFRLRLAQIRREGIAFDRRGSGLDSTRALAVPVLFRGTLECVLGCWYPTFRAKGTRGAVIAAHCRETAERLSLALERADSRISSGEKNAGGL